MSTTNTSPSISTKPQWKATYKSQKLKEKTLSSQVRQLFQKFQKQYLREDHDSLSAMYASEPLLDANSATIDAPMKLDQLIVQLDKLKLARSHDKAALVADCSSLALAVSKLKVLIESHASAAPTPDKLQSIEKLSKQIDDDLVRIKDAHKNTAHELDAHQKLLEKDLEVCAERIALMERHLQEAPPPPDNAAERSAVAPSRRRLHDASPQKDSALPQEIHLFNHFIATNGGKYGAWDPEDHNQFVALRSKFQNQAFIQEAAKRIPGQTPFTIQQHLNWYKQYLTYKKQKNEAIKQWKEQKEQQRIEMVKQREENELKQMEEEDEQRAKHEREERKRKKALIQRWKEQKQREQFQQEQELLNQQEEQRKLEHAREQERQDALKAQLREYKVQKDASEMEKQLEEELQAHKVRPLTAEELRRLEERNLQLAKKRLELRSRKERERHLREERVRKMAEAVHVEAPRDASRLTAETAAHKRRVQDLRENGADNRGEHNFNIRRVQHRAMPSWRRGT